MSDLDEEPHQEQSGAVDAARSVLKSLGGLFEKRLELAAVELQEEKYILLSHLFRLILIGVCALMALTLVTFLIVAACWETGARLYVIAGLALIYTVVGGVMFTSLRKRIEGRSTPFSATIEEFRKDREWFQDKN